MTFVHMLRPTVNVPQAQQSDLLLSVARTTLAVVIELEKGKVIAPKEPTVRASKPLTLQASRRGMHGVPEIAQDANETTP